MTEKMFAANRSRTAGSEMSCRVVLSGFTLQSSSWMWEATKQLHPARRLTGFSQWVEGLVKCLKGKGN